MDDEEVEDVKDEPLPDLPDIKNNEGSFYEEFGFDSSDAEAAAERLMAPPGEEREAQMLFMETCTKIVEVTGNLDEYRLFIKEWSELGEEMGRIDDELESGKISVKEVEEQMGAFRKKQKDLAKKWIRRILIKKHHPDKGGTDEELKKILDED